MKTAEGGGEGAVDFVVLAVDSLPLLRGRGAAWSGEQAVTWSWVDLCGIGIEVVLILGLVRKSGDAGVCPEKNRKHLFHIYKYF